MEEKKYLDLVGLAQYDKKIKELIKNYDAETLAAAEAYVNSKIGDLDVAYTTVAAALAGEKALREQADALVGFTPEEGEGKPQTLKEYVDQKITGDAGAVSDELKELIEKLYGVDAEDGSHTKGDIEKAADDATASAIAQLISDSEENPIDDKFDTLKEIADWILESEENAEALDAAERLAALEATVGAPAEGEEGEEGYKPATGLVADIAKAQADIDAFVRITETEIDALFAEEEIEDENATV